MKSVIHIFIFILASTSLSSFASEGDGERSGASPHDRGFVDSARESEEEREETQAITSEELFKEFINFNLYYAYHNQPGRAPNPESYEEKLSCLISRLSYVLTQPRLFNDVINGEGGPVNFYYYTYAIGFIDSDSSEESDESGFSCDTDSINPIETILKASRNISVPPSEKGGKSFYASLNREQEDWFRNNYNLISLDTKQRLGELISKLLHN